MNNSNGSLVLRDDKIVETVAHLERRINDRFPGKGLSRLCGQLLEVAQQASKKAESISNPIRTLRIAGYATACFLVATFIWLIAYSIRHARNEEVPFTELIGAAEAGINVVIFFTLALWFLVSLESRIKRERAIKALHELRSIAHIIDMHQLTKDPDRFLKDWSATDNSPKETLSPQQLNRYLDYCTEMLSLIGKIAALYIQRFDDPAAVAVVSEVEQLTTGLSRKIWQKIILLSQTREMLALTSASNIASGVTGTGRPSRSESPMTQQDDDHS